MAYLILSVLIVLADQATKYWISSNLGVGEVKELINGVIHLTYVRNSGAAFSIMANMRWVLVAISAVCAVLVLYILLKYRMGALGRLGLAAVLGGAMGNLIDRVLFGYVVDMLEVEFMSFAVFNIADVFITVGAIVFCIHYIAHLARAGAPKDDAVKSAPEAAPAASDTDEPTIDLNESGGDWSEEKILQEYDIERLLREYHDENDNKS